MSDIESSHCALMNSALHEAWLTQSGGRMVSCYVCNELVDVEPNSVPQPPCEAWAKKFHLPDSQDEQSEINRQEKNTSE